jgi:hypothetical protein
MIREYKIRCFETKTGVDYHIQQGEGRNIRNGSLVCGTILANDYAQAVQELKHIISISVAQLVVNSGGKL